MLHAALGASGAHRWMNCLGSPRMEHGIPDISGPYAQEGTAAHKLASICLDRSREPDTYLGTSINGFEVTDEMVDAIELYIAAVSDALVHDGVLLWVERRFSLARLDPPAPMFGTSDAITYDHRQSLLTVFDLKYGRGVVVEVEDNPQEMYYGLGALLEIESKYPQYRIKKIKLVIVQPRAPHTDGAVRSVTLSYEDVIAFGAELLERAEKTQEPDAPLTPGSWCKFCRAAAVCPALQKQAVSVAKREFAELPTNMPPKPETLSVTELVVVLNSADLLEDWLASVRAHVMGMLERGEEVPGFKAVAKRANRKWVDEELVYGFLQEHGVERSAGQVVKIKSPAQLEKVLKKHKLPLPEDLYRKVSSGNTMAPDSDPRPPLALGPANEFINEDVLEGLL